MVQITSAMAAKQLRKLNDQRDALLLKFAESRQIIRLSSS